MVASRVQTTIVEMVRSRWDARRQPFTLADLGGQLRGKSLLGANFNRNFWAAS